MIGLPRHILVRHEQELTTIHHFGGTITSLMFEMKLVPNLSLNKVFFKYYGRLVHILVGSLGKLKFMIGNDVL